MAPRGRLKGSARDRAVQVLREALASPSVRVTPRLGEAERGLDPRDRDLLRELVLGVLRWKAALDDEIAGTSRVPLEKLAPRLREILEVALYQIRHLDRIPEYAAVSEAVAQARASGGEGASRLVNGVLRGILLLPPPAVPPIPRTGEGRGEGPSLARAYSHPLFLVERWLARFGPEQTRAILEADNRSSPLDLLANPRRRDREALARELAAAGVETRPSPIAPNGLTVLRGNPLRTPSFAEGAFLVQDAGSQALPLLLPPGDLLVDCAAAPGGKSFAAILSGRARRSLALDASLPRLVRLEENRRRLGIPEVVPVVADVGAPPLPAGVFGRVLLDAPCSGTGTLRKSPEIRYRLTPASIERLAAAQEAWLAAAAKLVAPGGFLLYATCSLEEEENERVVGRVLARDSRLKLAAIDTGGREALRPYVAGGRLRLFPAADTDGFTAHLISRA
ncbi:MAG TPA: transcription antitermination factor NusB [Thermoanaerobaculia bacterium]|nr:transcription antitermination factor NusB [Thermoanaerobaculia bacterium]